MRADGVPRPRGVPFFRGVRLRESFITTHMNIRAKVLLTPPATHGNYRVNSGGAPALADGWAYSSAGEHFVDIEGVTGSIPVTPTIHSAPADPRQTATETQASGPLAPLTWRDAMKIKNSLRSLKQRHRDCRVVRRKGRVYVINKTQRRFKARQG